MRRMVLLLMLPLFLTACGTSRDPEDREYVITMGIDKSEKGYLFSFAPAALLEKDPEVSTVQSETIAEAMNESNFRNARKLDLGQMKIVILGNSLLQDKAALSLILEEMAASQQITDKVLLMGTIQSAEACLQAVVKEDPHTGMFLWNFYKNTAKDTAVIKGMDLETMLTTLSEQQGAMILPRIQVEETGIQLGGGVALNDGRYGSTLTVEEEDLFLLLSGDFPGILVKSEEQAVSLLIARGKVRHDFSLQGDAITETVRIEVEGDIVGGGQAVFAQMNKENLEVLFQGIIKDKIENRLMGRTVALEGDVFGLESRIRRKYPHATKESVDNAGYEIEVRVKVRDMGRIR